MTVAGQQVSRLIRLSATIAFLCSVILVWQAVPARADGTDQAYPGSILHVSASGSLTPGSVLTITATGTNAPDKYDPNSTFTFGLDLFLVSADELKTPCSTSEGAELTLSTNNPVIVKDLTYSVLNEGYSGAFKISTPVSLNNGTGHLLICAYSVYGIIDDAAWATTTVQISDGGNGGQNGGGQNGGGSGGGTQPGGGGGGITPPGGGVTQPGTGTSGLLHDLRRFSIVPLVWTGLMVVAGGITLAVLAANGTLRGKRRWYG